MMDLHKTTHITSHQYNNKSTTTKPPATFWEMGDASSRLSTKLTLLWYKLLLYRGLHIPNLVSNKTRKYFCNFWWNRRSLVLAHSSTSTITIGHTPKQRNKINHEGDTKTFWVLTSANAGGICQDQSLIDDATVATHMAMTTVMVINQAKLRHGGRTTKLS